MIKMIASDMDGTLLNGKKGISDRNLKAIKDAQALGVKFVIASGRAYDSILPLLNSCDLKCDCITGNGAQYIDEDGKLISGKYLAYEKACTVIEMLASHHIHFMIYTTSGYYGIEHRDIVAHEFALRGLRRFGKRDHKTYEEVFEGIKHHAAYLLEKMDDYKEVLKDKEIIKIEAFDKDEKIMQAFKPLLADVEGIAYLSSFPDNCEITDENATKGKILLEVSRLFGVKEDEVMVFGDEANDLSMFENFENGVAVNNASDLIKSKAKYITDDCYEDGVGKAIEKYILNR